MEEINLRGIHPDASSRIRPFLERLLQDSCNIIDSIYVVGTATTEDYDPKKSDINSLFVVKTEDIGFLKMLASLQKRFRRKRIAIPTVLTLKYIAKSIDVFPLEFLNLKLLHVTAFGQDIFENLEIERKNLRLQCERELKSKLIWLARGYISFWNEKDRMREFVVASLKDYIPLLRGIIFLFGKEPPVRQMEVIELSGQMLKIDADVLDKLYMIKKGLKLSFHEVHLLFERYWHLTSELSDMVDALKI